MEISLDEYWTNFRSQYSHLDDRTFLSIAFAVVHSAVFWGLNFLLLLCNKLRLFEQYKIQPGKAPDSGLVWRCFFHCVFSHLTFPLSLYMLYPYISMSVTDPIGSPLTVAKQVLGCMLIEDFIFYWAHRALHHRSIYKYIHKQHHEFKVSIGIASEYAHPVEAVTANLIPFVAGPILLKVHGFTFLVWTFLRIAETVDAHCGYRFPFTPWQLVSWLQGGAARHDFHHSHNVGSYGSFTKFWDWACGTDVAFREFCAKQDQKKKH
eukprot:TRINITY_DN1950_c0_g1::TRINITY_DN1950_c0_g1_i2::g.22942::m.22942 TRINITY_DN1950_c0_g1::TRINITY_DN1950_c0_g1_i2::g.22942  ORF type:complete len:280 (+),score=18.43,sp/Q55D54/MSMOB_DICDI/33.85/1e-38,FA_hydroxylase/PF04116.8/3.2e+03,FA_hydroxylase/PF04116.8/4.3e-19 TRINITY_DN1950_c0_g1_i2:49-840(+)